MYFKFTVQLTAVTLTVGVMRMTVGTSWGAIWKWSETVTYGCHAICCSRPTWLKLQMHNFPGWHGWLAGWPGPLLTTIVAAVVDWLLSLQIAQKQGKQVPSREGNSKRVLPTGRLSVRAPVANEDCGEGVSRGCDDGSQISAMQQHWAPSVSFQVTVAVVVAVVK